MDWLADVFLDMQDACLCSFIDWKPCLYQSAITYGKTFSRLRDTDVLTDRYAF